MGKEGDKNEENKKTCNCRVPVNCPLGGECLVSSVVYKATVKDDSGGINSYVGITEGTFKERYTGHKSSFNLPSKTTATTLSGHVWMLKKIQYQPFYQLGNYTLSPSL